MDKSPDAFRTISEVAEWLGTPTHVLRFWESRFTQVKPVKRAGGRRYYRPADMSLLGGIKKLLHDDGMTIRGVQKLLREEGVKHVAALSGPLDSSYDVELSATAPHTAAEPPAPMEPEVSPEELLVQEIVSTSAPADAPEAPMQTDVEQAPIDNVVSLNGAPHGDEAEQPPEETPEKPADADPEAEPEQAAPVEPDLPELVQPIVADVAPDPDDGDITLPGIAGVAAALRQARAGAIAPDLPKDQLGAIYQRLVQLRARMDGTPDNAATD